jgi:hypothetical protein
MIQIYRYNKTKRQLFNGWQKITNTLKIEDWATQTPLKLWTEENDRNNFYYMLEWVEIC